MTVRKPTIRNASGPGLQEVQLASTDLSDGPFLADAPSDGNTYGRLNAAWAIVTGGSGNGSVQRVLTGDLTIADGMSYVVVWPLETNGHVLELDGGKVGIF